MENPSSDQPGVLDHIAGAKSNDPDERDQAAQPEDPSKEASPGTGKSGEKDVHNVHSVQLRDKITQLERQLGNLDGYAQAGMAIWNTPEGRKIIERWQRGEELFAKGAQESASGLTREDLSGELDRRDTAKRQMDDLNELAVDSFPEFKKISKSPKYAGKLDATLVAVWNGNIPIADEAVGWADQTKAKNFTAMKEAYQWYLKDSPKVLEAAKEAGKQEADERNAAALAGELSSPSTSTSKGESRKLSDEDQMLERMMGARGIGTSFGSVGRV